MKLAGEAHGPSIPFSDRQDCGRHATACAGPDGPREPFPPGVLPSPSKQGTTLGILVATSIDQMKESLTNMSRSWDARMGNLDSCKSDAIRKTSDSGGRS